MRRIIVLQYNPEALSRTITARPAGDEGDRGEALCLQGPSEETFRLEAEIDVMDQLERA